MFAGITAGVMDLVNGQTLAFLRRAKPEELAAISLGDVASALRATIEKSGMEVADDALEVMAKATEGYAYLIQLVGYYVWRTAKALGGTASLSAFILGGRCFLALG